MPDWLPHVLTFLGVLVTSGITAWVVTHQTRQQTKVESRSADAEVQNAINDGFVKLIESLKQQLADALTELEKARAEMDDMRGDMRNLVQHIQSLERLLTEQGVELPPRIYPRLVGLKSIDV